MEKYFKQSVIEGLKCYVYVLVDPRNNCIFYVGKGSGNRDYQHAQAALVDDSISLKLSTIREIKGLGLDVKYYIIRHNLSEQEAYLVESSIIFLTIGSDWVFHSSISLSRRVRVICLRISSL